MCWLNIVLDRFKVSNKLLELRQLKLFWCNCFNFGQIQQNIQHINAVLLLNTFNNCFVWSDYSPSNDLLKIKNENTRAMCEIYSKLTLKTLEHVIRKACNFL